MTYPIFYLNHLPEKLVSAAFQEVQLLNYRRLRMVRVEGVNMYSRRIGFNSLGLR